MVTRPYIRPPSPPPFSTPKDQPHHLKTVHQACFCQTCGPPQSFASKSDLDTHIATIHPPYPKSTVDRTVISHNTLTSDAFLAEQSAKWLDCQREIDAEKAARRELKNAKAREERAERRRGLAVGVSVGPFAPSPGEASTGIALAVQGDPYGLRGKFFKGAANPYLKAAVAEPARVNEKRGVEVVDLTEDEEDEVVEMETAPLQRSSKVESVGLAEDGEDDTLEAAVPSLQPRKRQPEGLDSDSDSKPEERIADATSDVEDDALETAFWAALAEVDAEAESTLEGGEGSNVGLESQGEDGFDPSLLHPRWRARR